MASRLAFARVMRWDMLQHLRSSTVILFVVAPFLLVYIPTLASVTYGEAAGRGAGPHAAMSLMSTVTSSIYILVLCVSTVGSLHMRSMREENSTSIGEVFVASGYVHHLVVGKWLSACLLCLAFAAMSIAAWALAFIPHDVHRIDECIVAMVCIAVNASVYMALISIIAVRDTSQFTQMSVLMSLTLIAGGTMSSSNGLFTSPPMRVVSEYLPMIPVLPSDGVTVVGASHHLTSFIPNLLYITLFDLLCLSIAVRRTTR